MHKIFLPEVASTNSWVLDALSGGEMMADETLVYTFRQTNGRGQVGNTWESEPDKNISFSLLLKPTFMHASHQFCISELCCLGVLDGLFHLLDENGGGTSVRDNLSVKWPNDIYVGDEKLGGILIENRLMGAVFSDCILGVGLNVNQMRWIGNAPNPTSLRLMGLSFSPTQVLESVTSGILTRYQLLKSSPESYAKQIHKDYMSLLYRRRGLFPYVDAQTHLPFDAEIADVDSKGPLKLRLRDGELRSYWFKEVKFVLPCGVTKE